MRLRVLLWCIIIAPHTFHMCAMERSQSLPNRLVNYDEQPVSAAVKVLAVTGNFLSLLESVVENLQEQNKLKVGTLQAILDAADSPWQSNLVYAIEKILTVTPESTVPYLQRFAGACHVQGPDFIKFLHEQKKEKKSLSDFLRAVRHGTRYVAPNREALDRFLSTNKTTINDGLEAYHALLPALAAGVKAMHASLAGRESVAWRESVSIEQSEIPMPAQISSDGDGSSIFNELRFARRLLASLRPDNRLDDDPENDARDVFGEYNRIDQEITECGNRLNNISDDVFYDALTLEYAIADAKGGEGMTDWLK